MNNPAIYEQYIRTYPDFPKPNVLFRDIFPLIAEPVVFQQGINELAQKVVSYKANKILSIEARGFIVGCALALKMQISMIPARKPGKLPGKTISHSYSLEYGEDVLEMPETAVQPGDRVIIADDVLATGGTAEGALELIRKAGGQAVVLATLMDLQYLNGNKRLLNKELPVAYLLAYSH